MALIVEDISESQPKPTAAEEASSSGYISDGYETASETELNDNVSESEKRSSDNNDRNDQENGDKDQENLRSSETEVNEKALAQANDAKLEGNFLFKDGLYEDALSKYELAIQIASDGSSATEIRSICHANRAACFSKLGKFEETVKECTKALELNPTYLKALIRRSP